MIVVNQQETNFTTLEIIYIIIKNNVNNFTKL